MNTIKDGAGYLNGITAYTGQFGVGRSETGCLISVRLNPTSTSENVSTLSRTLAHELMHYLEDVGDNGHDTRPWNVFRDGALGSINNFDLVLDQRTGISISPEAANSDEGD